MDDELIALSAAAGAWLSAHRLTLATAESCTGGWIAQVMTETAGSSAWFERGFVTYSNAAKEELLGVSRDTLSGEGAVSEATVREMALGALLHSRADVAIAVSGIAGPAGGSAAKPVGTVCLAWCRRGMPARVETRHFSGDRHAVRRATVIHALQTLIGGGTLVT